MQWPLSFSNVWKRACKKYQETFLLFIKSKFSNQYQLTHRPLLDAQDLLTIHASSVANNKSFTSQNEVATLLVGERNSSFTGSGYEFAENQLYVAGDDMRFINWRLLARTGKMFRKKFIEERRPELWVIIDKRSTMRFGTKKRLKVTQAAIQAIYHLYQAHQQQLACAGAVLDETVHWYKPARDLSGLQPLIENIIAPAPPIIDQPANDSFNLVIRQLATKATPGSIILLLSDFHNISSQMPTSLYELTKKHRVIAKHIVDPIELQLPEQGKYQVAEKTSSEPHLLECDNANFRQNYQSIASQWQADIEKQLIQSGVSYQLCQSNENSLSRDKT